MSFKDQSGKAVGYSIDLCDHIVAAVKQKLGRSDISVNYIPVTVETRFKSIKSGGIDILCGATTKTLGRSEQVGFTQLTFATGASLLSLEAARRVLKSYLAYYNRTRTHLALDKDAPEPRAPANANDGPIVAVPEVNGLHHRYERLAA